MSSKLVKTAASCPLWIMATSPVLKASEKHATELHKVGCKLIEVGEVGGRPWLPSACEALVAEGITRLLVEGGPSLWRSFAEAGLVDEVRLFQAGAGNARGDPELNTKPSCLADLLGNTQLSEFDRRILGADDMITYRHDQSRA